MLSSPSLLKVVTMSRKAFTLIELLIVVAIIAILAAIAVPNFLEAQVRSKVSRAKADMRSLATAIEAYRVDNNNYIVALDSIGGWRTFEQRLVPLTTPVAFITSVMKDPFPKADAGINLAETFDFLDKESTKDMAFFVDKVWTSFPGENSAENREWRVQSLGPDMLESLVATTEYPEQIPVTYDPTNGTASFGDIHRYGP